MKPVLKNNDRVLFQGDSITDAGWNRQDPFSLGSGYAMMTAAWFSALHPDIKVTFMNRGISGNRVKDLVDRWKKDCLDLSPTWVSVLIGINDTWRRYDSNDPTSVDSYARDYKKILDMAAQQLKCRFIIIEPFVLPVPEDRKKWREDLDPRIHVVRSLAREYEAVLVPMDGIFAAACAHREPSFWAPDGVHPSPAGHALIAQSWLRAVGAL